MDTHPTHYITPSDTHCQPMALSTRPPTIHLHRPKGHSDWLDSQTHPIDITHVAQGGSWGPHLFWWYDKISYAPAPSAVRPFHRQATSDICWPIGHFCSDGWEDGIIGSGMGSGVMSTCVEVLWRILGHSFLDLFLFFFSLSWNHFLLLCYTVINWSMNHTTQ